MLYNSYLLQAFVLLRSIVSQNIYLN